MSEVNFIRGDFLNTNNNVFAGISSENLIPRIFKLILCKYCNLLFKSPMPTLAQLSMLYSKSPNDNWGMTPDSEIRRFNEIEELINKISIGRRVLDIGCNNGAMLSSWDNTWIKCGVEPSEPAANLANQRGIEIRGKNIFEIHENVRFDIITAIDVIEHISEPNEFFVKLDTLCVENGLLCFLTGNTDYWWWKIIKGSYWYSSCPEHLCFFSLQVFAYLAKKYNYEICFTKYLAHKQMTTIDYIFQLLKNIVFYGLRMFMKIIPINIQYFERGFPGFSAASDHILIVLRKNQTE